MSEFVQTRWGPFALEDSQGSMPPILLLHGGASNLRVWDNVVGVLEDSNRCVCIDLPGHGQTPVAPLTFAQLRDAILEICDALNLQQRLLVGHSFGGLAAAFAANAPGLAAGIMAIDPYLSDREVRRSFSRMEEALVELREMAWPWSEVEDIDAQIDELMQSLYTPRADPENLRAMIRRGYRQTNNGRYVRYPRREEEMSGVRANWSVNVTEIFKGVKSPLSIALAKATPARRLRHRRSTLKEVSAAL